MRQRTLGQLVRIALGLLSFSSLTAKASTVDLKMVTTLPRSETNAGVLVHAGHLWVSVSSEVQDKFGTVDIYDLSGTTKVASLDLGHSPVNIYPYGDHAVLVVGKSSWPWKSHATVITKSGQSFSKKTTTFSEDYMVTAFGGGPDAQFFGETGNAAVYRYSGGHMKPAIPVISGPGEMVLAGDKLWVIENRSFNLGDESLVTYDLKTGAVTRIFADAYRNGLSHLAYNAQSHLIAVTESVGDNVILLDAISGKELENVPVAGFPRGVIAYGKCFAVTGEINKTVNFLLPQQNAATKIIAEWDLTGAGEYLKKPRYVTANTANGDLFLRSAYPCPSCVPNTQSSVFKATDASMTAFKACFN